MSERVLQSDSGTPDTSPPVSGVPESAAWTAPDRLRWIADFLDLADKAISMLAYRGAQHDLRAWARWLDTNPALADDLARARADLRLAAAPSSQTEE